MEGQVRAGGYENPKVSRRDKKITAREKKGGADLLKPVRAVKLSNGMKERERRRGNGSCASRQEKKLMCCLEGVGGRRKTLSNRLYSGTLSRELAGHFHLIIIAMAIGELYFPSGDDGNAIVELLN